MGPRGRIQSAARIGNKKSDYLPAADTSLLSTNPVYDRDSHVIQNSFCIAYYYKTVTF